MDDRIHRVLCWIAVILALPILKYGQSFFLPVAIAIVAFHPFLPWFLRMLSEDRKSKKSVKATAILSIAFLGILVTVFGSLVAAGWYGVNQHPGLLEEMRASFEQALGPQRMDQAMQQAEKLVRDLIPLLPGIAIFIFLAWEYPPLRGILVERFAEGERSQALRSFENQGNTLRRFWVARTVGGLLTGLTVGLALWLMNVPLAWLWGGVNFLLNYIPTVGSIVGCLFPIGFSMVVDTGTSPTTVAIVVGVVQLLYGTFVDPLIQDRFLPLSSLTILVAIFFWGWVWGPWGALIGVPLTYSLGKLSLYHPVFGAFGKLVIQDAGE